MQRLFPTRSIALLIAIGFIDLVSTALLHANGLIVELNPVMKGLIEQSEWLFAAVKGATLLAGWITLVWYARQNIEFVRKASMYGAAVYLAVWVIWFVGGM